MANTYPFPLDDETYRQTMARMAYQPPTEAGEWRTYEDPQLQAVVAKLPSRSDMEAMKRNLAEHNQREYAAEIAKRRLQSEKWHAAMGPIFGAHQPAGTGSVSSLFQPRPQGRDNMANAYNYTLNRAAPVPQRQSKHPENVRNFYAQAWGFNPATLSDEQVSYMVNEHAARKRAAAAGMKEQSQDDIRQAYFRRFPQADRMAQIRAINAGVERDQARRSAAHRKFLAMQPTYYGFGNQRPQARVAQATGRYTPDQVTQAIAAVPPTRTATGYVQGYGQNPIQPRPVQAVAGTPYSSPDASQHAVGSLPWIRWHNQLINKKDKTPAELAMAVRAQKALEELKATGRVGGLAYGAQAPADYRMAVAMGGYLPVKDDSVREPYKPGSYKPVQAAQPATVQLPEPIGGSRPQAPWYTPFPLDLLPPGAISSLARPGLARPVRSR